MKPALLRGQPDSEQPRPTGRDLGPERGSGASKDNEVAIDRDIGGWCSGRAERGVTLAIRCERRRRQQDDTCRPSGGTMQRRPSLGSRGGEMRLVCDRQVPPESVDPVQDFAPLQKIEGHDIYAGQGPRVDAGWQLPRGSGQKRRVRDDARLSEASELVGPLIAKSGRRHDEDALGFTARGQFRERDQRLDGFAQPHSVRDQNARRRTPCQRQRGLELPRQQVNRRAVRRLESAGGPHSGRFAGERAQPRPP